VVRLGPEGERILRWPTNAFYHCKAGATAQELVLFVGMEPQLKWKTFIAAMMDVIRRCNTQRMIFLGSLLDTVPHTREPRISGSANNPKTTTVLEEMGIRISRYEGPTSAPTVLMEACRKDSIDYATLWAHSPHYLQASPNPKVSHALLKRLASVIRLDINLADLADAAAGFDTQVNRVLADNQELAVYIRRLEEQYDQATERPSPPPQAQEELPRSDVAIQDLEEFLRGRHPRREGGGGNGDEEEGPGLGRGPGG
jgi:proteasome assembly chaperone (PAC2) family protein